MRKRDPNWDELKTFRAVMRSGSLSSAARSLGIAQPTVGRHIDGLEDALGVKLFTRSPQGLVPTDAAQKIMPDVDAMAVASASLSRVAASTAAPDRGVVRITASQIVGHEVLPLILADFRKNYPAVEIELVLSNAVSDLSRREADIAVRMTRPSQKDLVASRVAESLVGFYAHRDYLARMEPPKTLQDLRGHLIGFDQDDRIFRAVGGLAATLRREDFVFRCDYDVGQLAALRAGLGVGGCQQSIARRTPELEPLLADQFLMPLEVWIVMHGSLRTLPRMRIAFNHIKAGLEHFYRN